MTVEHLKRLTLPDEHGRFGAYGGMFVPEILTTPLRELEAARADAFADKSFISEFEDMLRDYVGRPTPLFRARNFEKKFGGKAQVYVKREDLTHTGAHKINNALGQALLALRLGKKRIIAETGAGQHGVAAASVCALLGLECVVYMGEVDMHRQMPNVQRMKALGAKVRSVVSGGRTLKDAVNEAIRDWVANAETSHYLMGSVVGPHPYPRMVRDFQSIIGREARDQCIKQAGRLPDCAVACVGGGSNAIGLFSGFRENAEVELVGVEAAGRGLDGDKHAASMTRGTPGVLHGALSYVLQDTDGQILEAHSVSAGLDYPSVGPEHAFLKDSGRVRYVSATDEEAIAAFKLFSRSEGIIPALEPAHAIAYLTRWLPSLNEERVVLLLLSGRGDKDMETISSYDES